MDKLLTKYWFEFDTADSLLRYGIGITAYSYEDAINIMQAELFKNQSMLAIKTYIEDFDVRTLDANHILPNIGPVNIRGIWYPLISLH